MIPYPILRTHYGLPDDMDTPNTDATDAPDTLAPPTIGQRLRHHAATLKHQALVMRYLLGTAGALLWRGLRHDWSKHGPREAPLFAAINDDLKASTYGSEEYKARMAAIRPAIDHHQTSHRHHPEYWPGGLAQMTLVDFAEMVCDWKAATRRHADGSLVRSAFHNGSRFGYGPTLVQVIANTAEVRHPLPYKLIIFDADGTLRGTHATDEHGRALPCPNRPGDYHIKANVRETLQHYRPWETLFGVASNQAGVHYGYLTEMEAWQMCVATLRAAAGVHHDPYLVCIATDPDPNSMDRKPNPGMLLEIIAQADLRAPEVMGEPDTASAWRGDVLFVGDQESDRLAALGAGCDFMWAHHFFGFELDRSRVVRRLDS